MISPGYIDQGFVLTNTQASGRRLESITYGQQEQSMGMRPNFTIEWFPQQETQIQMNDTNQSFHPNFYGGKAYHYAPENFAQSVTPLQSGQLPLPGVVSLRMQNFNENRESIVMPIGHHPVGTNSSRHQSVLAPINREMQQQESRIILPPRAQSQGDISQGCSMNNVSTGPQQSLLQQKSYARLNNNHGSVIHLNQGLAQPIASHPYFPNSETLLRSSAIRMQCSPYLNSNSSPRPQQGQRKVKQSSTWTAPEDRMLRALKEVKKLGWREISTFFNGRTPNACQFRWRRIMSSLAANESKSVLPPTVKSPRSRLAQKVKESKKVYSINYILN